MRRRQLVEFEDLPWFPSSLRDDMTDFLQFVSHTFDLYRCVIDLLREGLEASGNQTIIDLASGGGGGLVRVTEHLRPDFPKLQAVLTDKYPNTDAWSLLEKRSPGVFRSEARSIGASDVPEDLVGLRTQFLSLHHFRPDDAKQILQNAVDRRSPIAIFEAQKRDLAHLLKFSLAPINVLLVTPFIRPFRLRRLFFTYVVPVLPLLVGWDGVVSVLRTYSTDELHQMTSSLANTKSYTWQIGERKGKAATIVYLLGIPSERTIEPESKGK